MIIIIYILFARPSTCPWVRKFWTNCPALSKNHQEPLWQCPVLRSYILISVRFQTKSSLVWKGDSKNVVIIFQTKPSLVWKLKMLLQISKPDPVWFGNFLCRICGGNKFQIQFGLEILFSTLIFSSFSIFLKFSNV